MITLGRVAIVVGVYAVLWLSFRLFTRSPDKSERTTFLVLGGGWALSTFVGNWLLSLIGAMSFMPWITNALHTFVWIGFCLTWLYFGVRFRYGLLAQFSFFAGFSLVVKVAERLLFGTWEHDHFIWLVDGNVAYIVGWSLMDGLYPFISIMFLRLLAQRLPKLRLVIR